MFGWVMARQEANEGQEAGTRHWSLGVVHSRAGSALADGPASWLVDMDAGGETF
jgi:hypothetical protein